MKKMKKNLLNEKKIAKVTKLTKGPMDHMATITKMTKI